MRALTGAIREGRLHHAFLFCGPRGTGKTSTARILAKMVNCEQGPTAEPCGACSQCVVDPRGHAPRRRRDRRGQPRWRRRRSRAPREGADRAGAGPREGLHHRRGAAALPRGVRRPAEGLRGAAGRRAVRARHHRAAQDAGHDRRTVPAVRLPAAHDGARWPTHLADDRRARGRDARAGRPRTRSRARPRDRRATRSRCWTRRACSAAPTIDDDAIRAAARRASRRGPARAGRRGRGRRRPRRLRGRRPARPGRAGPAERHGGVARDTSGTCCS